MTERHNTCLHLIGCSTALLKGLSGYLALGYGFELFQNKKIIYANKFFCWQALKIDLILKIYFMFNDHIETLVLEQI